MINRVGLIGLGALGIMFGQYIKGHMDQDKFVVIADEARIRRYQKDKIYCNGQECSFSYETPEAIQPLDLIIIGVKQGGLSSAIESIRPLVGKDTILVSMLNGIVSEDMLMEAYERDQVVPCVAQGMDAYRKGNGVTYTKMGELVIGEWNSEKEEPLSKSTAALVEFFDRIDFPYSLDRQMGKAIWRKFLLNVGVNQVVGAMQGSFATIQEEGHPRERMIAAMREVQEISQAAGIGLTDQDIEFWLGVLAGLSPEGKPSLAQDLEAKRPSEVELFSGTIMKYGKKYGIKTPVNESLYKEIKEIEASFV